MTDPNLTAAFTLADHGIAVFPCDAKKRPRPGVRWKEEATTDKRRIESWWRRFPNSLPAFSPGPHGLVAIDCDRHGKEDGVAALVELAQAHDDDPRDWPTVETPSSGRHVFFRQDGSLTNARGALPAGIDVRGSGGYIIAEGATLPDGRDYHALGDGLVTALSAGGVPDLPAWLRATICDKATATVSEPETVQPAPPRAVPAPQPDNIGARERAAFEAALEAEVRNVATAGEGQRNHTLNTAAFCLAQMVASGWGSRQEVEAALTEAAFAVGLRQPEIGKTIRSGINSGMAKPRPPLGEREGYGDAGQDIEIRLTKVGGVTINAETGEVVEDGESEDDELETIPACDFAGVEPPPRDWHVPDLVPARTVTILTGDGATGKSLLALQLAVATAAGTRWIGNDVKPGRALFLTAEDEIDEAHRRLIAITGGEGVDLSGLGTLRIASLAGKEALLAVPKDRSGVLTTTPLFRKLACTIDRHRPAVVVLDTLADLFGGNEIDRAQARQFIGFLRSLAIDYDTTIVLLAHPSLSGMASGSGNSGSTAWNNSARSRLYLHRVLDGPDQKESDPDVRILSTVKANYGKSGGKIELRWSEGRFIPESEAWKVDIHLGPLSPNKAEEVFLRLLKTYLSNGVNVAAGSSPNYAPRVFANDERSEGVSMKAFKKAMHDLMDRGIVDNVIYGPPSKGHRRLDFALPKSI